MSELATLGEALPKEIQRNQKLLEQYAFIGPAGQFGYMFIKQDIAAAHEAMMEQDLPRMIAIYERLKANK